ESGGCDLRRCLIDSPIDLVAVHSSHCEQAIVRLRRHPEVRSVQPNTVESGDYIDSSRSIGCNDPGFSRQWYLYNATGAGAGSKVLRRGAGADVAGPLAWRSTPGSSAVRIA